MERNTDDRDLETSHSQTEVSFWRDIPCVKLFPYCPDYLLERGTFSRRAWSSSGVSEFWRFLSWLVSSLLLLKCFQDQNVSKVITNQADLYTRSQQIGILDNCGEHGCQKGKSVGIILGKTWTAVHVNAVTADCLTLRAATDFIEKNFLLDILICDGIYLWGLSHNKHAGGSFEIAENENCLSKLPDNRLRKLDQILLRAWSGETFCFSQLWMIRKGGSETPKHGIL